MRTSLIIPNNLLAVPILITVDDGQIQPVLFSRNATHTKDADFNNDGIIDKKDAQTIAADFGKSLFRYGR